MPIYSYRCTACGDYQELMMPAPPPEFVAGGECGAHFQTDDNITPCNLKRMWVSPGIGPMNGAAGKQSK